VPLRDDLLNPVSGDNPSGVNLRYEKVYDQIKEARTEDDESIPTGAWARTIKRADFNLVIKLAGEALANKSKDLQLAAWLTEAHVRKEGVGLIQPCFKLFQDLQDQFWDTLYPVIEDGDVGMRAVPIEWTANRIATILRECPITRDGLNYYQYKESRAIGYEAEAEYNDAKTAQRQQAIADGKATAEDFDKSFNSTPKAWYVQTEAAFHASVETVDELQVYCEQKYGDDGPGFGKLRTALEEVGQVVTGLLNEKRKTEPDAPSAEEMVEEPEPEVAVEAEVSAEVAPAAKVKSSKSMSAEPADKDDAFARVQACAVFLQKENPASPVPYLLQAALRFGETREAGSYPAWDFLAPPPTEKRQNLKRLTSESNWAELLAEAIAVSGESCGRGWLDVQRYIWKASYESSYTAISASVIATVQALLKDMPEIPTWTLSDDTPTANPETQRWLEEMVIPKPPEPVIVEAQPEPEPVAYASSPQPGSEAENAPPDILDTARELMARGHLPQALQLLMRDAAQQPSGRARFQRRLQMAQLCVGAGQGKVAYPVLEELVKEIDQRQLEEWEASEIIATPLALLLRCLDPSESGGMRESVFARLCRIDPIAAMDVSR
jgi:type VI secretion system protein ImpA